MRAAILLSLICFGSIAAADDYGFLEGEDCGNVRSAAETFLKTRYIPNVDLLELKEQLINSPSGGSGYIRIILEDAWFTELDVLPEAIGNIPELQTLRDIQIKQFADDWFARCVFANW